MRKIFLILAVTAIPVFAGSSIDFKAGAASAKAFDNNPGFNAALAYNLPLDKNFAFAIEPGFFWLRSKKITGESDAGDFTTNSTENNNAYSLPLLGNLKLMFPVGSGIDGSKPAFQPYLSVGAGYTWTKIVPGSGDTTYWEGFTYQAMLGGIFRLGGGDFGGGGTLELLLEAGYRGIELGRSGGDANNSLLDFSGIVINAGVRLPLTSESGF